MNEIEKGDLKVLIELYCKGNCQKAGMATEDPYGICSDCTKLLEYAFGRLDNCPYKEAKPVCSACPIHCYNNTFRAEIKKIMRYSGPRIAFKKPAVALRHLVKKLKKS